MSYQEHEDEGYGPRLFAYLMLLFLCVVLFTYAYFKSQGAVSTIGENFKFNFLLGFVAWLGFYIFLGRRKGFAMGLISLVALQGAFLIGGLAGGYHQALMIKNWEAEWMRDLVVSSGHDEYGYPKVIEKKFDQSSKMKGELGEVDRWVRSFVVSVIAVNNEYAKAIEESNWKNILDPARIESDLTLIESRIIVRKVRELNADFRDRIIRTVSEKEKEIEDLNIGKPLKNEMRVRASEGFSNMLNDNFAWEVREKSLVVVEKIIDLLSSNFSHWSITNGEIMFDNARDSGKYREYLSTIKSNAQMLENINKKRLQSVQR